MDVRMREVRAEEGFLPGFALMYLIPFRQPGTTYADIPRAPDVEEWCDEQRCIGIGTLPPLVRKHLPCLGGDHKDQPRTRHTAGSSPKLLTVEPDLPRLGFAEPDEESRSFREYMRWLECRAQHRLGIENPHQGKQSGFTGRNTCLNDRSIFAIGLDVMHRDKYRLSAGVLIDQNGVGQTVRLITLKRTDIDRHGDLLRKMRRRALP